MRFYQHEGFSAPEIHPRAPDDELLALGREMFTDASVHLPSYVHTGEDEALAVAEAARAHGYTRLIIHPYVVREPARWRALGAALVFENLDFRFVGQMSAEDLRPVFAQLPEARFCLDIAHAHGWCPEETGRLLAAFGDRLAAIHYSEIDPATAMHLPTVAEDVMASHARYLRDIPESIPVVFEVAPSPPESLRELRTRFFDSLRPCPTDGAN